MSTVASQPHINIYIQTNNKATIDSTTVNGILHLHDNLALEDCIADLTGALIILVLVG